MSKPIKAKPIKAIASFLWIALGGILIAACTGNTTPTPAATATPSGPQAFSWNHSPGTVVFQMTRAQSGELQSYADNRLPLCTLFGDDRLIWTDYVPLTGQQVLQTTLSDTDARAFLTYLINDRHFFSIPNYTANQLTPTGSYSIDTMSIVLNEGSYTAQTYGVWPHNEYQTILDKCTHLATNPTPYIPVGGWLSVAPVAKLSSDSQIGWVTNASIHLADLSRQPAVWISGRLAQIVWEVLRRNAGAVQWQEGTALYRLSFQVPGLSPDAPPAPAITPTPYPTLPPTPRGTRTISAPTPTIVTTISTAAATAHATIPATNASPVTTATRPSPATLAATAGSTVSVTAAVTP